MTDFVLAVLHHILVFGLAGVIAAELASVRTGLAAAALRRLGVLDAHYGALAVLIIVVGVLRVIYGAKGADYYLANPAFWAKMAAFAAVGLLSVGPTTRILAWRRRARTELDYVVPVHEVRSVRRFLLAEIVTFAFIPIFAAAMATGFGQ